MKVCDYCGRENQDTLLFCAECGTLLVPPKLLPTAPALIPPPLFLPEPPRELRAGPATLILLGYLAAQVFCGFLAGIVAGIMVGMQGLHGREAIAAAIEKVMPISVPVFLILGGIVAFWLAIALVPARLRDTSPTGAAWVCGRWPAIGRGLLLGMLVAGGCVVLSVFGHQDLETKAGPLTRMAMTPGLPQVLWLIAALLLAPPVEELLFRGVLYGGYRRSLGPIWAAALTTFIFVLLHFPEVVHSLTAVAGITGLALTALWSRLRSGAIGPAIAVHIGYNAVVALATVCSTWT